MNDESPPSISRRSVVLMPSQAMLASPAKRRGEEEMGGVYQEQQPRPSSEQNGGPCSMARLRIRQEECEFKNLINECRSWIEASSGKKFQWPDDFRKSLESGVHLCELLNALKKDSIRRINRHSTPIAGIDNLNVFLKACQHNFQLNPAHLFDITDLEDLAKRRGTNQDVPNHHHQQDSPESKNAELVEHLLDEEQKRRLRKVIHTIHWLSRRSAELGISIPYHFDINNPSNHQNCSSSSSLSIKSAVTYSSLSSSIGQQYCSLISSSSSSSSTSSSSFTNASNHNAPSSSLNAASSLSVIVTSSSSNSNTSSSASLSSSAASLASSTSSSTSTSSSSCCISSSSLLKKKFNAQQSHSNELTVVNDANNLPQLPTPGVEFVSSDETLRSSSSSNTTNDKNNEASTMSYIYKPQPYLNSKLSQRQPGSLQIDEPDLNHRISDSLSQSFKEGKSSTSSHQPNGQSNNCDCLSKP